jgi:hypothetical protein
MTLLYGILILAIIVCSSTWRFYSSHTSITPASLEKMSFVLPDKPSIAVLPFKNIGEDPNYDFFSDGLTDEIIIALSYAYAARTHLIDAWLRFSDSPRESIRQSFQFAEKAISLDNLSETGHSVLAGCYLIKREHQKAIEAAKKGLSLSPNSADCHFMLGQMLIIS